MRIDPARSRRALLSALLAVLLTVLAAVPARAADEKKASPTPTPKPRPTITPQHPAAGKDGMVAVPAGKFFRGCNEEVDFECLPDEKPGRYEEVAAFRIDVKEVTVAQYARCVAEKKCTTDGLTSAFFGGKDQPEYSEFCNWEKKGREKHPINCVTWKQADAFCTWAGKRLPTESEWERAARGTDGRKYPWGDEHPIGRQLANIADESARKRFPEWTSTRGYNDGHVGTAPVGSYPDGVTPAGTLDMIGNVWEWTADGNESGRYVRGASWTFDPALTRVSLRGWSPPDVRAADGGFRCVK